MKRYVEIDGLRGFLLFLMMIDHLPGFVRTYSYQMFGFVSAAEGFVFISGYVAGIVYSRILFKNDLHVLATRTRKRARTIYFYHLIVYSSTLLLCLLAPSIWPANFKITSSLFFYNPVYSAVLGPILLYQPAFLFILPMYVIFLLGLPVFLRMFYTQKEKTVFTISIFFWFFAQAHILYRLSQVVQNIIPVNLGNFDIMGWQFIFIAGSYLGFRKFKLEHLERATEKATSRQRINILIFSAISVFFLMLRYGMFSSHIPPKLFRHLFEVHSLGLLRLANFFALAYLISFTAKFFEKKKITRFFAFLGQHSLQVFSFHIIILYAVVLLCENWQVFSIHIQLLLYFSSIILLLFSAWLHRCYQLKKIVFHNLVIV